jgi:hypothetical protein
MLVRARPDAIVPDGGVASMGLAFPCSLCPALRLVRGLYVEDVSYAHHEC